MTRERSSARHIIQAARFSLITTVLLAPGIGLFAYLAVIGSPAQILPALLLALCWTLLQMAMWSVVRTDLRWDRQLENGQGSIAAGHHERAEPDRAAELPRQVVGPARSHSSLAGQQRWS